MSYDYLMFKKPRWYPRWIGRARAMLGRSGTIGTDLQIKDKLSQLFPHLIWQEIKVEYKVGLSPTKDTVLVAHPAPEFQIHAAVNGEVANFVMRRADSGDIRKVERALGVVAMDIQGDGILGILFRG